MRIKSRLILLLSIFLVVVFKSSGKEPVKFGKIGIEEFKDLVYPPDTSAVAVVLCQYGFFDSQAFQFIFTRRVKILKKEGVDYANYIFRAGENATINGKTYNLENGVIVEDKLKNESIFKERIINDLYRIRFAMPNVKVGSIIDIETIQTGLPSSFRFQEEIPVKHAEILLESRTGIEYSKRWTGEIQLKKNGSDNYYADNVPAFRTEPFMDSEENYISKFEFDLLEVNLPGFFKRFTTDWESVDKILRESDYFGNVVFFGSNYLSDLSDDIKVKFTDPIDRTRAAYEAIKSISWNKEESLISSSNALNLIYKKKVANSAEINMMLCQLLNSLDIEATPVVLSTRSNGLLSRSAPSIEKLNYTIVCAAIDGKNYLMDATEKYLPFGLLPERCLNKEGRSLNRAQIGQWVSLIPEKEETKITAYELQLGDDLTLKGKLQKSKEDYAAFNFRCEYRESASDESFINDMETQNPGLLVKDFKITRVDSIDFPTSEEYDVEIKNKAEKINDQIIINPFLYEQLTENPFKSDDRKYPVNFPYLTTEMVITKLIIPKGFIVAEMPKPISIELPGKSATALINFSASEKDLLVVYKLQFNKLLFFQNEYELLKELYSQIIKKQAQPIVLKPVPNASNN